jgi:hypothetical protein
MGTGTPKGGKTTVRVGRLGRLEVSGLELASSFSFNRFSAASSSTGLPEAVIGGKLTWMVEAVDGVIGPQVTSCSG